MKTTQKVLVKNKLIAEGKVSRNWCLNLYPAITRLGAIIHTLKRQGMEIEGREEGNDFVYTLINRPPRTVYEIDRERGVIVKKILP